MVPWASIVALIEPHYPQAGNGTQPMPLERMLHIHFMQQSEKRYRVPAV